MRMDKYKEYDDKEKCEDDNKVLSREIKNQKIYTDVYMNNTLIDINNFFNEENKEEDSHQEDSSVEVNEYHEKSYDVNEYLEKAHEMHKGDEATRNLDNQEFIENENQIKELIANIEEKEQEEDFFSDLRGDDENTMIGAKLKTDEFDTNIFLNLVEGDDRTSESDDNLLLNHALGEQTVYNMQVEEDEKLDHTFEKIVESDKVLSRKIKKLPLIIFSITLVLLVAVIVIILLK